MFESSKWIFTIIGSTALVALALACHGGGSSGNTREVSFGVSDAPVGNLSSVTITIASMTLQRDGDDDVVIETFDTDEGPVEQITIDLLDYQGSASKIIVEEIELEIGDYDNLRLEILDEDTNESYVIEDGSMDRKLLKVPSDELKLGGFDVEADGSAIFIIEFNLMRAMTYNPGPDRYILKPRGVRVVGVETAGTIQGDVAADLLDDCGSEDPTRASIVYLYEGIGLVEDDLADLFDPTVDMAAPPTAIEPFAAETLGEDNHYTFAFVPAGDYTVAFSCDAIADDADLFDDIVIPNPEGQIVEVSPGQGDDLACDFALAGPSCL